MTNEEGMALTYKNLNKQFYEKYDEDYFIIKAHLYVLSIGKKDELNEILKQGMKFKHLEIKGATEFDKESLDTIGKSEVVNNYYHCIESLFRLLIANEEEPDCPWVGIASQTDFREFKRKVKKIVDKGYYKDELLEYLFFGGNSNLDRLDKKSRELNLENVKELLRRFGRDLLDSHDYNTFKHGNALFNTEFGFSIDDGSVIGVPKQDSFVTLSTKYNKEKKVLDYGKRHSFMDWEYRVAHTMLATQLMHNLINIGGLRTGASSEAKVLTFDKHELDKLFKQGIVIPNVTISEFYREVRK